jgi:hypothetical protein
MNELEWAESEFADAELGDERRTLRAVKVAAKMAAASQVSLPKALVHWADIKGAYRLFDSQEVTHEALIESHVEKTRSHCRQQGTFLLIEDTSLIDLTHRDGLEGAGRVGDNGGYGFYLHTTLAAGYDSETDCADVIGLFDQQVWIRKEESFRGRGEKKRERLSRDRESEKWALFCGNVDAPPAQTRWIYVADRESDVYEAFVRLRAKGDFVIRACQPRALEAGEGSVFDAVKAAAILGRFEIGLRARPGQRARTAQLEVRACKVVLRPPWRPEGKLPVLEPISVVEICESGRTPKGVTPLHWVLLSSLPTETFEQAISIARIYKKRWLVEEYHKSLKTGTSIEESQLATMGRIDALLGISAVLAVRLLALKNRRGSNLPFMPEGDEVIYLKILTAQGYKPKGQWTERDYLRSVAKMGGFIGRKSDGDPGWQTIWRGMSQLVALTEGYKLAQKLERSG